MAKKIVAVARSPLADKRKIEQAGYRQEEIFPLAKIILRGKGTDEAFVNAVREVSGAKPPQTPNTAVDIDSASALLWLGPEEWLLRTAIKNKEPYRKRFATAFAALHAAAVDVSDYYTVLRLSGRHAQAVLAHGCPLDLRRKSFPVGHCAQSHYRHAAVILSRISDDGFDMQVRWSVANYLWDYCEKISQLIISAQNR